MIIQIIFSSSYPQRTNAAATVGTWTNVKYLNSNFISTRYYQSSAYISITNEFLVLEGFSPNSYKSDFYSINMANLQCSSQTASGISARGSSGYTVDPNTGDFYVHGGGDSGTNNDG